MKQIIFLLAILLTCLSHVEAQPIPISNPKDAGIDETRLKRADKIINEAIQNKEFPGAVLAVVRHGKLAYIQAYGNKQLVPSVAKMTTNTVFDIASLTKPIATATSVMILIERGQLRLLDNVSFYLPRFEAWRDYDNKKKEIKIVDLLTHTSGLPAYPPVEELKKEISTNPNTLIDYISTVERRAEPGTGFIYSDLNYVVLQKIIEDITKQSLQDFAKGNIFNPLGMKHTDFKPKGETLAWTAPTQKQRNGTVLKGDVHDPLARFLLDGVSGNAGLFSNAEDLAILATMLLNNGEYNGERILSPLAVKALTTVPRKYEEFGRTLGWDNYSAYASNNGDIFSQETFGHTGYTGTSMTIDPVNQTAVILLTNRVHPQDKGSQVRIRSLIANIVAGSVLVP